MSFQCSFVADHCISQLSFAFWDGGQLDGILDGGQLRWSATSPHGILDAVGTRLGAAASPQQVRTVLWVP